MEQSSVQKKWGQKHELNNQHIYLNGVVLTGRGSWMKPNMSAAQFEARGKAGLSTTNPTHACSGAKMHQKDCEEKRDPDETRPDKQ